jgi:hypothetical protein
MQEAMPFYQSLRALMRTMQRLFFLNLFLVFVPSLTLAHAASFTYTYNFSSDNLLYGLPPDSGLVPDTVSLTFTVSSKLLPNSTYDISVLPGTDFVSSWEESDTRFGIVLTGTDAPVSLVPPPVEGNVLNCSPTASCFGGAVQTDKSGKIIQWDLVAFANGSPPPPYLVFITYNTPELGNIDGLGSTQNGNEILALNTSSW